MADASLRGQLLRLLLLPVAGILAVSSSRRYYLAREPATDAYDGALIDAGIALADRIHVRDGTLAVDLPSAAEQILRTDRFDTIYYMVRDPSGKPIAGDAGIPPPPVAQRPQDGSVFYDATYRDTKGPCRGAAGALRRPDLYHHGRRDDAQARPPGARDPAWQRHAPGRCSRC